MQKFTAGPWLVVEVPHTGLIGVQRGDRVLCLDGDQEADAHLIAAAPDLLEALDMYSLPLTGDPRLDCAEFGSYAVMRENARRAAVKKARGEA
jgi:hypothetical protein